MPGLPGSGKGEAAKGARCGYLQGRRPLQRQRHCLATVFAKGVTVYHPCQVIRELVWEADPCDILSLTGGRTKKGLRGVEMMRSYDMLRCIDRFAELAA